MRIYIEYRSAKKNVLYSEEGNSNLIYSYPVPLMQQGMTIITQDLYSTTIECRFYQFQILLYWIQCQRPQFL
jgi:hypothetical protein